MTQNKAEVLLATVIVARSTSYLLMRISLNEMSPFTMLSNRFLLAFLVLALLFWKRIKLISLRTLGDGALLGAAFFAVMAAQVLALKTTSSSATSLLESTAIVFVPLLEAILLRRFPPPEFYSYTLRKSRGIQ